MNVSFKRLRSWNSCRAFGLGVQIECNTLGTDYGDPREKILYKLTVTLGTRVLQLSHLRRISEK